MKSGGWTFLTNYAHVLICIVDTPEARMRDIAEQVAITERAVQRIVGDLEEAGYIQRVRAGRRNRYKVRKNLPLRHRSGSARGPQARQGRYPRSAGREAAEAVGGEPLDLVVLVREAGRSALPASP